MGIGTLIVFIAMVLVAAVAAAVLISTSGTLQQRAAQTGKEATAEVSSNFKVIGVYGVRNTTGDDIYRLKFNTELSAGAVDVDMQQLIIRYADDDGVDIYTYDDNETQNFALDWIRGEGSNDVMKGGDLLEISFDLGSDHLAERTEVEITFIPETGTPVYLQLKTPSTYSDKTTITLQ